MEFSHRKLDSFIFGQRYLWIDLLEFPFNFLQWSIPLSYLHRWLSGRICCINYSWLWEEWRQSSYGAIVGGFQFSSRKSILMASLPTQHANETYAEVKWGKLTYIKTTEKLLRNNLRINDSFILLNGSNKSVYILKRAAFR